MSAKMPSKVMAMGGLYRWKDSRDVPDTLNAVLEYPEGFTVNLSSTFNNQSSSEESFLFLGTEGTLSLGSELKFWPEGVREDNRWIVESWPKRLEAEYWQDPKVRKSEMPGLAKARLVEGGSEWREQGQDASVIHFWHFLNSIQTRKAYWEDAVAGHHAAACAHMVNQSARSGRLVAWDFAKDDIGA
jgi:predicted dehydrogenase